MEEENGMAKYELLIPDILKKANVQHSSERLRNMIKNELDQLTPLIARARNIFDEHMPNAIAEIEAYQEFFKRDGSSKYDLFSVYSSFDNSPDYTFPVKYFLRNKMSNFESALQTDISFLLDSWGS